MGERASHSECPSLFFYAVINTVTKSSLEGQGFICYSLSKREVRARTQGRNLELGTDAEAMEGAAYILAPLGLFSLHSYTTRTTSPGVPLPTLSWVLPYLLSIKKMLQLAMVVHTFDPSTLEAEANGSL